MIFLKKTIILPLLVISILFVGLVSSIDEADAVSILTLVMPSNHNYTEIEIDDEGRRSYVREQSIVSEEGKATLYAKKTSRDTFGQAEIEFTKIFTVNTGDIIKLTARGHVKSLSIGSQNVANVSHFQLFPTVHDVGDFVGTVNQVYCNNPIKTDYTSSQRDFDISSIMICDSLPAGTYEFSAYGHVRANSNNNSYTSVSFDSVELVIKRTSS